MLSGPQARLEQAAAYGGDGAVFSGLQPVAVCTSPNAAVLRTHPFNPSFLVPMSRPPLPSLHVAGAATAAVLDTQVVLDWLVFEDAGCAALAADIERGSLRWLATPAMLGEIDHVLDRGVASAWRPDRTAIRRAFERHGTLVEAPAAVALPLRCTDPDDQMFIDLAQYVGARWLLSRDRALLALRRRAAARGIGVLRPADWPLRPGRPEVAHPRTG